MKKTGDNVRPPNFETFFMYTIWGYLLTNIPICFIADFQKGPVY